MAATDSLSGDCAGNSYEPETRGATGPGGLLPECSAIIIALVLAADVSFAWIYPEHRDITILSVGKLDPGQRATLDALWAEGRAGKEERWCEQVADGEQGRNPGCIDWAAWAGIAGDHFCSADELVANVLTSDWILDVAAIAARLKTDLAKAGNRSQRVNAMRASDIRFQRADHAYATWSGANFVHFLLARTSAEQDGVGYLTRSIAEGAEPNAIGSDVLYHLGALEKAALLSRPGLSRERRTSLARGALADEAFASHFLEDSFAAGHVAGIWGDAAQRKGTHDFYNEHGVEAMRWGRTSVVLMGDAFMRPEDAELASMAVRTSLEQVLDQARGRVPTLVTTAGPPPDRESLNICTFNKMPALSVEPGGIPLLAAVIPEVPAPGLGPGKGDLPRFRAELGPFVGLSTAADGRLVDGGFGATQTTAGGVGGLELALRLGLGLEGVLNESGDGLVFLDVGVRLDAASTLKITGDPELARYGAITAAIPSRTAYTARLRLPFFLIPGDLVLALPLLVISPDTYTRMVVVAGNGGLIHRQSGIATLPRSLPVSPEARVGVSFYDYGSEKDPVVIPSSVSCSYLAVSKSPGRGR